MDSLLVIVEERCEMRQDEVMTQQASTASIQDEMSQAQKAAKKLEGRVVKHKAEK